MIGVRSVERFASSSSTLLGVAQASWRRSLGARAG
jgi:hypothetical protein